MIQTSPLLLLGLTCAPALAAVQTESRPDGPTESLLARQIEALRADKEARLLDEQKLESNLLYLVREVAGGPAVEGVPTLRSGLTVGPDGRVVVDLRARPSDGLRSAIEASGGLVEAESPRFRAVRARLRPGALLELAARSDVAAIRHGHEPIRHSGSVTSEGDAAHAAPAARAAHSVDGTGVKVGVISDSADGSAHAISLGDLPPSFTVLPGRFGSGSGEGTAMSEIVHDLAPGAEIFFASANGGKAEFADAILELRAAGCDVIVDDISYSNEWQFQDDEIGRAVNTVVADGALYFSSAGNEGNALHGNSTTWEGDFADLGPGSGILTGAGRLHTYGTQFWNELTTAPSDGSLQWSDEYNSSSNDYDLLVLDSNGTSIVSASTDTQSGTQEPYEFVYGVQPGERIVVLKYGATAEDRYLRLSFTGGPLLYGTEGQTIGHAGTPNCICVAASEAPAVFPNAFSTTSTTETFSSDGPHKQFHHPDGSPITPGNFLAGGGRTVLTPALTAADGVVTTRPASSGLNPFYGTSAAAPHAAAITALCMQRNPNLDNVALRAALEASCLDVQAPGFDVNSGHGILMADLALATVTPATIGTTYCVPTANSTGLPGSISATGSVSVASNQFTLHADQLPPHVYGMFIASMEQDYVPTHMGSAGHLCLGGSIGRMVGGQILFSGPAGAIETPVDLTQIPTPNTFVAVQPGETWNFQAWSRDVVNGSASSNFTDGLEVLFH